MGGRRVRKYRMDLRDSPASAQLPLVAPSNRATGILATTAILALLYIGRDVLLPITLAVILSLLIAPLVRRLRRMRLSPTLAVLVAVLTLTLSFAAVAAVIGVQVARMAASLPQYEETIHEKLATLNDMTIGKLNALAGQAGFIIDSRADKKAGGSAARSLQQRGSAEVRPPIPVELHDPPPSALQVIKKVVGSVWVPLETTGIVLVVLIFVLLEHDALRDRLIRITGGTDIRSSTLALNDAGERLSRFFVSQFAVNLGVGTVLWLGLHLLGLPHALVWGAMAALLRFVPYVGIWIAALFSAVLAAAVDPGWTLAASTLGFYLAVELIAGQLVEPRLYGHTTGLSPLSVVIAAVFWSWLWGPVGLIVSTPLTLCLLVAGRHVKALSLLDILLGDNQALTMPQRFYQRALSGDSEEIIASAKIFLKRNSFAGYCDLVLMPALHLARLDLGVGAIVADQQIRVRNAIVAVVAAIGGESRRLSRRERRGSVLDTGGAGRQLRQRREKLFGQWQGPLAVAPGSIMLCIGLGPIGDELATELLVRILRDRKIDARHLSIGDLAAVPPPESSPESVSMAFIVSAYPGEERAQGVTVAEELRRRFPKACIATVYLPGMRSQPDVPGGVPKVDREAASFSEAVQVCIDWHDQGPRI
jgi:predicted PurR-regulated permease PerM